MSTHPTIVVIGGPNGAGKTTISRDVLAKTLKITEFVNADAIAAGLSGFEPDRAAFAAGRVMLERLRELAAARASFAFESTLASRSFAPWLANLVHHGFEMHVLYVWLRTPELAVRRVQLRVRKGGHGIPPDVIRRRYARSAANLFGLYVPLARSWRIYDNSGSELLLIARRGRDIAPTIYNVRTYSALMELAHGRIDSNEDSV